MTHVFSSLRRKTARVDETTLVKLLREKDSRGFQYVYQRVYPTCQPMLRRMGLTDDECLDAFQDGVIVLYEKLQDQQFALTAKVSTYLYSVCQNIGRTSRRKSSGKNTHYPLDEAYTHGDPALVQWPAEDDPEPVEETIGNSLEELGSPCRDILRAFYYHSASIQDIMTTFGYKTLNSTKVAKHKCMQRLKKKLVP